MPHKWFDSMHDMYYQIADGERLQSPWNPLASDGDALQLAVKLHLHICPFPPLESDLPMGIHGFVEVWKWDDADPVHVEYIDKGGSYEVATRRAIVCAAAAIAQPPRSRP